MRLEMENFARKLAELMAKKEWSQSDLAREVWGEMTTSSGRPAARNRDRISNYLRGNSFPDPVNLRKIAKALDVEMVELAPDITAATIEHSPAEFAMTAVSGHPDKVYVRVNKLVSWAVATMIARLLDPQSVVDLHSDPVDPNKIRFLQQVESPS